MNSTIVYSTMSSSNKNSSEYQLDMAKEAQRIDRYASRLFYGVQAARSLRKLLELDGPVDAYMKIKEYPAVLQTNLNPETYSFTKKLCKKLDIRFEDIKKKTKKNCDSKRKTIMETYETKMYNASLTKMTRTAQISHGRSPIDENVKKPTSQKQSSSSLDNREMKPKSAHTLLKERMTPESELEEKRKVKTSKSSSQKEASVKMSSYRSVPENKKDSTLDGKTLNTSSFSLRKENEKKSQKDFQVKKRKAGDVPNTIVKAQKKRESSIRMSDKNRKTPESEMEDKKTSKTTPSVMPSTKTPTFRASQNKRAFIK